jgi:hypothetical protein
VNPGRLAAAAGLAAGAVLLSGCVAPASSTTDYEADAAMSAEGAVSAARTAVLATQAYANGKLPANYLEPTLVDAEDTLDSIQSTFTSIQPPHSAAADELRADLQPLLDDAGSAVTEMRIAIRRDRTDALVAASGDLATAAEELDAFAQEHAP